MALLYYALLLYGGPDRAAVVFPPPPDVPMPRPCPGPLRDPAALAAALGHDHYPVRRAAHDQAARFAAHPQAPTVFARLARHPDPEVRMRAGLLHATAVAARDRAAEAAEAARSAADQPRRRQLIKARWPLPFVDSLWYDPEKKAYVDPGPLEGMRRFIDLSMKGGADAAVLEEFKSYESFGAYRFGTAKWLLELDAVGVPLEWVDPILAVMRERDAVYLANTRLVTAPGAANTLPPPPP